jgi:hypothetical protein
MISAARRSMVFSATLRTPKVVAARLIIDWQK